MQAPLPEWDLSDLYTSVKDDAIKSDQSDIEAKLDSFAKTYKNNVSALDNSGFYTAICEYQQIVEIIEKLSSYAYLIYSVNSDDPDIVGFYQNISEYANLRYGDIVFFTLEINALDDNTIKKFSDDEHIAFFAPWLRSIRKYKNHQLDEKTEKLLLEKYSTSRDPWIRLYEDTCNSISISFKGDEKDLTEALELLSSSNASTRKTVAQELSQEFEKKASTISLIYNVLVKDHLIESKLRAFSHHTDARHLDNDIEKEIVDVLEQSVTSNYSALSQRYYHLKSKLLASSKGRALHYWDRNAPLFQDDDTYIPWDVAKDIVLSAYKKFAPFMAELAEMFFEKNWIHASLKKGKTSGAYSHPTVPSCHPYILINYQGNVRDVMTLAHELGHGVHQLLACEQGVLIADTPLTLAETASVFGEMIVFRYLLESDTLKFSKPSLLSQKIEDMLNTVTRQMAFYRLEKAFFKERQQEGEVPLSKLQSLWMETQQESFGTAIMLDDSYKNYWLYISHFFYSPFYVYAYAFGDCLVNAMYHKYSLLSTDHDKNQFVCNYQKMLSLGGREHHTDLLKPFDISLKEKEFWNQGLSQISALIDELEQYA